MLRIPVGWFITQLKILVLGLGYAAEAKLFKLGSFATRSGAIGTQFPPKGGSGDEIPQLLS